MIQGIPSPLKCTGFLENHLLGSSGAASLGFGRKKQGAR
jgi:hypothetical protein